MFQFWNTVATVPELEHQMKKPEYLDELINRASEAAGNDNQLAKALDVGRSAVSEWRKGLRTCPAADQALMAQIAGLDAEAWAARAIIEAYEGTPKGEKLANALKKALLATGAVAASFGANAYESASHFIRCIFCSQKENMRGLRKSYDASRFG